MGSTKNGYPYPEGTDLVMDGDDAIKALAEAVDTKLAFGMTAGSGNVASVASQDTKSATVTLPTGLFTVSPRVVAMATTTSPSTRSVSALTGGSTSSFSVYAWNGTASTRDISFAWTAVQDAAGSTLFAARAVGDPVGPIPADVTVTCPTPTCENYGIPIPVSSAWIDEDGGRHDIDEYMCGVCETDLSSTVQPMDNGGA